MSRVVNLYTVCAHLATADETDITAQHFPRKPFLVVLCNNVSGFSFVFRDSSEASKVQMDPTRDAANPYVGLAFKLEVSYNEK